MIEMIGGHSPEIEQIVNEQNLWLSAEYYVGYGRKGSNWIMARARIATNNESICNEVNKALKGRKVVRTTHNTIVKDVVIKGTVLSEEITTLGNGIDSLDSDNHDARQYWDDLSGKELNGQSVNKA